jgi:multiple sugar transport system substrate-binding protein
MISYNALPTFMDSGGLVDLGKYGAAKVKDQFVAWTWAQVSRGSQVYAIPQDTGPLALAYNKAIFDQYSLAVPKTWDEFAAAGKKLYDATDGKVLIGNFDVAGSRGGLMMPTLLWADGGQFWKQRGDTWVQTIDSPKMLKILKYWADLVKKGYVTNYFPYTTDYFNAIGTGHVATVLVGAFSPKLIALNAGSQYAGKWRIAPVPQWSDMKTFTSANWGGSTNAVTVHTKNPLAAAVFAIWFSASTTATDLNWLNGGLFPAAKKGLQTPTIHDTNSNTNQYFGGQDLAAEFEKTSNVIDINFLWAPWYNYTESTLSSFANSAVKGEKSWEQALSEAQKNIADFARGQGYKVVTE